MKTFIYFVFTCFISIGALFGAMHAHNPFPAFAIAFGIWALFVWGYVRRAKKEADKRSREQLFENYCAPKSAATTVIKLFLAIIVNIWQAFLPAIVIRFRLKGPSSECKDLSFF